MNSSIEATETEETQDKGMQAIRPSKAFTKGNILSENTSIWKSKLSWRVAGTVFLTIVLIQSSVLAYTLSDFKKERLSDLRIMGRSTITPLIHSDTTSDPRATPFMEEEVERLINTTPIKGLSVYTDDITHIKSYGAPLIIKLSDPQSLNLSYHNEDETLYENVYSAEELKRPYHVVLSIDSSTIKQEIFDYVEKSALLMLVMAVLVTIVSMISLGHWLLQPIFFLRNNLMKASRTPENPNIPSSPYDSANELGSAIKIAHKLITQNANNIRQIKTKAEDRIHKIAYYDRLTELPNRTFFLEDLGKKTEKLIDDTKQFAVAAIDLDHFKDINDSMGHHVGDLILQSVGKRLRNALPEDTVVSRSGEDEFAVTMELTHEIQTAAEVGQQILSIIRSRPFTVYSEEFQIRASVGVATFPRDATEPDKVLKNADIALNRAKEEGRDCLKEYSEDFDKAVQERFQMLRDLRNALDHDELSLHFQPQLSLHTGELIGAEALIRWWKKDDSPEGGKFISPAVFIPIAEQSGLVVPIGQWVAKQACLQAKIWQEEYGYKGRIAINVSGVQFAKSDLVNFIDNLLKEVKIDPATVELEVTESSFMDDMTQTIRILQELHDLGVELAIDDFGTGYSSLSYLRQFPVDRLKVDRSFVVNALENEDDASITHTIIALARALNLKVIAEGVETIDHELFLINEICDEVQGFRYSRPLPADEFTAFIQNYNNDLRVFDKPEEKEKRAAFEASQTGQAS